MRSTLLLLLLTAAPTVPDARPRQPRPQAASTQPALPTVAAVYERFAVAVGGRDAWAKVTGRTEQGTVRIAYADINGTYLRYNAAPNRIRMILDLGIGKLDQGFDGTVGWIAQPGMPAERMPADQQASTAETARVGSAFLDPSTFKRATVAGRELFDGVECYKVDVTMPSGDQRTDYLEVATGLRRGVVSKTPTGPQRSTYRNWKAFEGKKIATSVTQTTEQGDVVITISSVSFGAPPASVFARPAGIRR